jgi:hypothetical protein
MKSVPTVIEAIAIAQSHTPVRSSVAHEPLEPIKPGAFAEWAARWAAEAHGPSDVHAKPAKTSPVRTASVTPRRPAPSR